MQTINKTIDVGCSSSQPDTSKLKLLLLKSVVSGSVLLGLFGGVIYLAVPVPSDNKQAKSEAPKTDNRQAKLGTPTQPLEPPPVVVKKPNKPIEIEEGSAAWFCLQNNGGSGCLTRDRFAPNYQVVEPPQRVKTYEDYLVQYGVREPGYCDRYLNGRPNC